VTLKVITPSIFPQAKVYDGSCAVGLCILLSTGSAPKTTKIEIDIKRNGVKEFSGITTLSELKRDPHELVDYLFRENSFRMVFY
jgi:2-dehydro-3-deoxy-D-arabinonate dehydratase